eukprot:TRINITY_DN4332_c0_g1_i1.p1 TRINITY_DN4332_c0_g1~~TRINITY_DN4332_c0_g1_i1.p1  ORF type:complete len:529 (-),score=144.67 TRINITY_DN4332_c0_g1_i1:527-2113(-)
MSFGKQPGAGRKSSDLRSLGGNETFSYMCHKHGNLNRMIGLTLLTRRELDEGLLKCALQEFQHMFPQLTSRLILRGNVPHFHPMECPTLPLDSDFTCRDMLHDQFDTEVGPLWRVQLITEKSMDKASIDWGPEIRAILEDTESSSSVRWKHFLRYFQGKVNQAEIENFDEEEEGFRSFILLTFHPSITDVWGAFHFLKQFMLILDIILEKESSSSTLDFEQGNLPAPIETLVPSNDSSFHIGDLIPITKKVITGNFALPRRTPLEKILRPSFVPKDSPRTEVLRGWLNEQETSEIISMMEEDDASIHGVLLTAGLIALSRVVQEETSLDAIPREDTILRATNETNLRQYCTTEARYGCLTTFYDDEYVVPPVSSRNEFWRLAHEMTVKHNAAKGGRQPLKMLRVYNKMFNIGNGGEENFKGIDQTVQSDVRIAAYGDLGNLFRKESNAPVDSWNRPLSKTKRNIRLEDIFHTISAQSMGTPFTHSIHILHGKLNYFLQYYTTYVEESVSFLLRDETLNILRMAADRDQ